MATVELEHVDKTYPGGTRAVVDCTLSIDDGEAVAVVGPSGCGKSSVLRLVAGLEQVTSGTVRIGGRVVNELTPQERNVAMVFQDYALYPHMSVRGNLEFPLRMRQLAPAELERRVAWVADLLDITAVLDRLPKQLSGGQRQRVAMGRALVREPTVFLLDEPLSNLDAKLRVQVRAEIGELQRRTGRTMIYVTHDQVEALTLGHRVAVLDRGRLQQVAAPRELYEYPANVFVASFIGSPPMNLFSTRLSESESGQPCITLGDQTIPIPAHRVDLAQAQRDGTLTGGIRPEAFQVASTDAAPSLGATVEHTEWLGYETLVYVRVADHAPAAPVPLAVRLPGMHDLAKGAAVRLQIDTARFYLFDAAGKSLTHAPAR